MMDHEAAAAVARHMAASGFRLREIVDLLRGFVKIGATRVRALIAGGRRGLDSELNLRSPWEHRPETLGRWQERGGGRARTNQ